VNYLFLFQGKSKTIPCFNPNTLLPGKRLLDGLDWTLTVCVSSLFSLSVHEHLLLANKISLEFLFAIPGAVSDHC
jgi:hypothetical protein